MSPLTMTRRTVAVIDKPIFRNCARYSARRLHRNHCAWFRYEDRIGFREGDDAVQILRIETRGPVVWSSAASAVFIRTPPASLSRCGRMSSDKVLNGSRALTATARPRRALSSIAAAIFRRAQSTRLGAVADSDREEEAWERRRPFLEHPLKLSGRQVRNRLVRCPSSRSQSTQAPSEGTASQ